MLFHFTAPHKDASFVISCYDQLHFYVLSILVPPLSSESNLKMWEPSGFFMHRMGEIICQSECHLI